MKLLYIEASPRKENSCSSRVANAFVQAYVDANPNDEIEHLPLFDIELPSFTAEGANQKMAQIVDMVSGGTGIDAVGEWAGVAQEIERLRSADKVVVSSPMWNFSIPYRLKHYLDIVCQPGLSFYVNAQGQYIGTITGKPIQFVLASGSPYEVRFPQATDGTKTDFQRSYLEHIARFIGFEDIRFIKIEPTGMLGPEDLEALLVQSCAESAEAGNKF
ncbi:MAG: FMN-dependent NADH-azoreductase, partial [Pseudomonadales bacterium]